MLLYDQEEFFKIFIGFVKFWLSLLTIFDLVQVWSSKVVIQNFDFNLIEIASLCAFAIIINQSCKRAD